MTAQTFHVSGMHCPACVTLIEGELTDRPDVVSARASLADHRVHLEGPLADSDPAAIIATLSPVLQKHGYALSLTPARHRVRWREFLYAVPIALAFLALFFAMQRLGIVNLVSLKDATYATSFFIGVIASLSTCMAVVGGLTLSVTANFAKEGDRTTPQILFHAGRLAAFVVLGGVIGALGTQFAITPDATLVLNIAVGIVMLILGLNLLEVLPGLRRLTPSLPRAITRHLDQIKTLNHTLTPVLLGAATFFLPCGFTQSMQLYTLTSGGFAQGAMTMGMFALGTLPVLGLLSFASLSLHSARASGIFFKSSGLVVIAFAVLNIAGALIVAGYLNPWPRF